MAAFPLFQVGQQSLTPESSSLSDPMQVCIFGSSYIKRLRDFTNFKQSYLNLGLDPRLCRISFRGYGGLLVRGDPHGCLFKSNSLDFRNADIILLHMGSNDLSDTNSNPYQLALAIVSFAGYIIHGWNPKCVVISELLPRKLVTHATYNEKVAETNKILASLCIDRSNISLWHHRAGLLNPVHNPYDTDGIHLSKEIGYPLFSRSVRDAILRHIRWFCLLPTS
ncbi:hypothetical protein SNE40_018251 [Patella caerulea]|uniref:SGNH hydrolase-type esterase domain-containing protein n=1 Tax=Patella caerulea TaxID=87958 RepID=A0AAN8PJZ1_PATCE